MMDETSKAVGELFGELRHINLRLANIETTLTGDMVKLELRVRHLELWRSALAGGIGIVAAGLGWLKLNWVKLLSN